MIAWEGGRLWEGQRDCFKAQAPQVIVGGWVGGSKQHSQVFTGGICSKHEVPSETWVILLRLTQNILNFW